LPLGTVIMPPSTITSTTSGNKKPAPAPEGHEVGVAFVTG
jgi:hypothetical protein